MLTKASSVSALTEFVKRSPRLYGVVGRYREKPGFGRRVVRRGDDCVIEGFPRSANTFATRAFRTAQPGPLVIGNHCHAVAQIVRASRFGTPCMLLIREPQPAIMSYLLYSQGRLSTSQAIASYCSFYRGAFPYADHWSLAPFDEVVTDFATSIDRLNRSSGSSFARYRNTEALDAQVRESIDAERIGRIKNPSDATASALRSTIPSAQKTEMRELLRVELDSPAVQDELAEAMYWFERTMDRGLG